MAWTQADADALKASIARGVRDVSYADKRVSYRSLDEMLATLRLIEREIGTRKKTRIIRTYSSKGF